MNVKSKKKEEKKIIKAHKEKEKMRRNSFKLLPQRILNSESVDSSEYSIIENGNLYIKKQAKEHLRKDLELKKLKNLNEDFSCYVRLSPKRRHHSRQNSRKNSSKKQRRQRSSSKSQKKRRLKKEISFVEFDSCNTLIKGLVREIDTIVERLNKRAERIYINYSPSKFSSRLRAESPEIRNLRKKTIDLVRDGEGVLKRLSLYEERRGSKYSVKSWMHNLNNEGDLRRVLTELRTRLKEYIRFLRSIVEEKQERSWSQNRENRGKSASKSREKVRRVPETYSEYKRRKAAVKFEKVELQLKKILSRLNEFKEEPKTEAEELEVILKPKRHLLGERKPNLGDCVESNFKIQKKPLIQPEFCTTDFDNRGYNSGNFRDFREKENVFVDPFGHIKYFEEIEGAIQRQEEGFKNHTGYYNFEKDYEEKAKIEQEERAKALISFSRSLNAVLKNSILMKETEELDIVLEGILRQIKDSIMEFKGKYNFLSKMDKKLKKGIQEFEKKRKKAKGLLDQGTLFDRKSKEPFLLGIWGLVETSIKDLISEIEEGKGQFKGIIPEEKRRSIPKIEFSTPNKSIFEPNRDTPSAIVSPRKLNKPHSRNGSSNTDYNTRYNSRSPRNMRVSFSPKNNKYFENIPKIPFCPVNSTQTPNLSTQMQTPIKNFPSKGNSRFPSNSPKPPTPMSNMKVRLDHPPEGFTNTTPNKKKENTTIINIEEGEGCITVVKLLNDDFCAIGFTSGDLIFYDLRNFQCLSGHREHNSAISTMEMAEVSMKGKLGVESKNILLTGGSETESSILVWDIKTQRPLKKLSGHENLISSIIDLQDSASIATASFDCKVAIWDLSQNFNCIQLLEEPTSPLLCLDFNTEDNVICAGCLDGAIIIWQVFFQNGLYHGAAVKNRLCLSGHIIEITRSSSLPNTILALESDFIVRLYSIETAQLLKSFQSNSPFVDFVVVERPQDRPVLFCLDNKNEIHRFDEWNFNGLTEISSNFVKENTFNFEEKVNVKQFIGHSPKTQVMIKGHKLILVSADQVKRSLILQELKMQ